MTTSTPLFSRRLALGELDVAGGPQGSPTTAGHRPQQEEVASDAE